MDWINRNIKDTALLAVIVVLGLGAIAPEFIPENDVKSSPVVHQAAVSFFEPAPLEILTSAEGSEPVVS